MSGWLLPIYSEGFTDPFFQHSFAMSPWSAPNNMREAARMSRLVDSLFPFYEPGAFSPNVDPSNLAPMSKDGKYQINIAAKEYKPNEITVKTVERDGKKFIVTEGKHETKDANGYHSVHHFKRQYMIPDNVKVEEFKCQLGQDGTLCIEAPQVVEKPAIKSTEIPVQMVTDN